MPARKQHTKPRDDWASAPDERAPRWTAAVRHSAAGQIDFGNVVSAISDGMATGMPQADGSVRPEARMEASDAADAVFYMASLPLSANVLSMTVMATKMPLVGRG